MQTTLMLYRKMPHCTTVLVSLGQLYLNWKLRSRLDIMQPGLPKSNDKNDKPNTKQRNLEVSMRVIVRDYLHNTK